MSIQMLFKSPSTDGLSVKSQSRDLETTTPVPFDEVLKDEEKRLQEEKEVSVSSVTAVLSAMQPQAVLIPVTPVHVTEDGEENSNPDGMRASTLQPITAQLSVNSPSSKAGIASNSVENQAPIATLSTAGNQPELKAADQTQANLSSADDLITQVGTDTIVAVSKPVSISEVPQSNINAVESGEAPSMAKTTPGTGTGQDLISAETNKTAQDVQLSSVKTAGIVTATTVPAAIQADNQLKAQPNLENIKASQTTPAGEESSPAAKDQVPVPTLESTRTTAAADMQTFIVKGSGKLSMAEINSHATEVIQQIMSQMKVKMKGGDTSMRLLLNPKELGEIEVQMIRNKEGVSVTFFAEQAGTARMLETQMNQLRQSLKDAGVQLTDLNFSQHDQPKQEGGFLKQGPQFNQYLSSVTPQTEIVNKVLERPQRIDGLSNEVDYLI